MNLSPGRLSDQLNDAPALFVFLRHFGCIFCRETIADIRSISERNSQFPRVIFFFQGGPTEGRAFLRRYWPSAHAIADPEAEFYADFGIKRGSFLQNLGPSVLRAHQRAKAKGHSNGPRSGDIWRMPGVILTQAEEIVWSHAVKHAADQPDLEEIAERASKLWP
jgi:hypothetical protein